VGKDGNPFGPGQQIGGQPVLDPAQNLLGVVEVIAHENAPQDAGTFVEHIAPAGLPVFKAKIAADKRCI
jgi:hypothetical protein